jgi:hypothetical protein
MLHVAAVIIGFPRKKSLVDSGESQFRVGRLSQLIKRVKTISLFAFYCRAIKIL